NGSIINVQSTSSLVLNGTPGPISVTGVSAGQILFSAGSTGTPNPLTVNSSFTLNPGPAALTKYTAAADNGSITFADGTTQTIQGGGAITIGTPVLTFGTNSNGSNTSINATGDSVITINSGGGASALTINGPSNAKAIITTTRTTN